MPRLQSFFPSGPVTHSLVGRLIGCWMVLLMLHGSVFAAEIYKPQTPAAASHELQRCLKAGTGIVLVVAAANAPRGDDESYGDWADNLKSFLNSAPSDVKVMRLTPALYEKLISGPKLKQRFATVFVRDEGHALVYDGRVVEQRVYKLGLGFMGAGKGAGDAEEFAAGHQKEFEDEGLSQQVFRVVVVRSGFNEERAVGALFGRAESW